MQDATSPAPLPALRIFLCHSSGDKPAVRDLYKRLKNDGCHPWLDEENLLPGQDWRIEIPKAVRDCDVVAVCLSNVSITKEGYVQKEIRFALDIADEKPEGTIFIIPMRLEEVVVPERLSRWQWVNYFEADGYDKLRRALNYVSSKTGKAAVGSAQPLNDPNRPFSSLSPDKPGVQWTIKIDARLEDLNELDLGKILRELRQISADMRLELIRVEAGTVKLFVNGSQEGFERVRDLFEEGRITQLLGYTIIDVHCSHLPSAKPKERRSSQMKRNSSLHPRDVPSDSCIPERKTADLRPSLPLSILREAIRAVPAVKFALGIAGIIAAIAIIQGFNLDLKIAAFGSIVMFVLMTMLVVFARLASASPKHFHLAGLVLTWFSLLLTMATAVLLFTSVFWRQPVDLTSWFAKRPEPLPASNFRVSVPADKYQWDTHLDVHKGDRLQFSATGEWSSGISTTGPNGDRGFLGIGRPTCGECPMPGGNLGELIGKIGDGPWFSIGRGVSIGADYEGDLFLSMNENMGPCKDGKAGSCYEDNKGTLEVTITEYADCSSVTITSPQGANNSAEAEQFPVDMNFTLKFSPPGCGSHILFQYFQNGKKKADFSNPESGQEIHLKNPGDTELKIMSFSHGGTGVYTDSKWVSARPAPTDDGVHAQAEELINKYGRFDQVNAPPGQRVALLGKYAVPIHATVTLQGPDYVLLLEPNSPSERYPWKAGDRPPRISFSIRAEPVDVQYELSLAVGSDVRYTVEAKEDQIENALRKKR